MFKKSYKIFLAIIGIIMSTTINAETRVFHASECSGMLNSLEPFLLILQKGDNIHDTILKCLNAAKINNASISGIGAIQDPILAYYDLPQQKYLKKQYNGIFELLALNGNVSMLDNKRMLHLHTVIGKEDYSTLGGHLVDGTIGITGEVTILPMQGKAIREFKKEVGLPLITPQE